MTTRHDPTHVQRIHDAEYMRPCPSGCPHPNGSHREYERGDQDAGIARDPRYRPLLFRCSAEGCSCENDFAVAKVGR